MNDFPLYKQSKVEFLMMTNDSFPDKIFKRTEDGHSKRKVLPVIFNVRRMRQDSEDNFLTKLKTKNRRRFDAASRHYQIKKVTSSASEKH